MTTIKSAKQATKTTNPLSSEPKGAAAPEVAINNGHSSGASWRVKAATGALKTNNPIREIIETLDLAENPNKKLIPLSIGDPTVFGNLKPCTEILDALQKASNSGQYYGYQTAAGLEKARDAVAEYHRQCTGNLIKRQDVILASGCSHAIDLCICVLAERGQNILIPRPGFPLYKTLTSVYGVEYKQYNLLAEQDWSVDLEHLESLIDSNTAAIVINNPSNPCGSVFSRNHLMQILDIAERYRLPIIADEIYEKFVFASEHYRNTDYNEDDDDDDDDNLSSTSYDLENRNPIQQISSKTTCRTSLADDINLLSKQIAPPTGTFSSSDQNLNNDLISNRLNEQADSGIDLEDDASMNDIVNYDHVISHASIPTTPEIVSPTQQHRIDDQVTMHHVPFISISALSERVPILTCGGISKTCLIPGLRLGWIIINDKQNNFDPSIRNGLGRLTQRLMGPNSLVQGALHDILMNVPESFYKSTMDFIFKNAKLCFDRLKLVDGLRPYMPQGSMYLMVRFDAKSYPKIDGDLDFTSKLMNEESVLVLPGKCFDFPNYFRICLTVPTSVMEEAIDRIAEFCHRHYVPQQQQPIKIDDYSTTHLSYPIFNQQQQQTTNNYIIKQQDRIHVNSSKFNRE